MTTRKNQKTDVKTKKRPVWVSSNSDLFQKRTAEKLDYLFHHPDRQREVSSFQFQKHQKHVKDFLSSQTPYRGILLYHGLGSGKTCSSIAIAEGLKVKRKVIFLSPASLEANFYEELVKCGDDAYKTNQSSMKETYSSIHYDGIRTSQLEKYKAEHYFDNKTIIIDEVHNLISMMSNQSKQGILWYEALMSTQNTRFIFLSGTPVVNYIHEYAYLFNILRGPIQLYSYSYAQKEGFETVDLDTKVKEFPHVDFVRFDAILKKVYVTLPEGRNHGVMGDGNLDFISIPKTHEAWVDEFVEFMKNTCRLEINAGTEKRETHTCFPTDRTLFESTFLDQSNMSLLNTELFMRRIIGLVSYFMPLRNEDDFPVQHPTEIVETPMSLNQFFHYEKVRFREMEEESNAMKKWKRKADSQNTTKNANDHENSTYKIYSRAACNFSFPETVVRPTEKEIEKSLEQLKHEAEGALVTYMDETKALSQTEIDERVSTMSPKYYVIQNVCAACPGNCLIYTVLRHMEGVDAFTKVLGAYGWSQISIYKLGGVWRCKGCGPKSYALYTGTEQDPKVRFFLKSLYNNVWDALPASILKDLAGQGCTTNLRGETCKGFIITKTGAEGITLKNVRQVHIIESHWNAVRTKQVIGRAVRYESHKDLPKEERDVRIYQYVTCFGEDVEALKSDPRHGVGLNKLLLRDKGKTTDQHVYQLAEKKGAFAAQVEEVIRKSAFDCSLNNPKPETCVRYSDMYEFAFDPDFQKDVENASVKRTRKVVKKRAVIRVDPNDKVYKKFPVFLHNLSLEWDESTTELFYAPDHEKKGTSAGTFDGKKFKKVKA